MKCVYCLKEGQPSTGRAHVFPEALKGNAKTLPLGAVCDLCNQYLGKLDRVVAAHPIMALSIQLLGLPGKKGMRDRVGNVDRTIHKGAITVPCDEPIVVEDSDGSKSYRFTPLIPSTFDMLRFRRGLYHIAFNLVALVEGIDEMYDSRYDNVRRYIRRGGITESWEFGQFVLSLDSIHNAMFGGIYDNDEEQFVGLRLFNIAFFLDLHASGRLREFLRRTQPKGTEIVEADWKPEKRQRKAKQYRLTVVLEEDS